MEIFTYIIIGLLLLVIVLLIWQLKRGSSIFSPLDGKLDVLKTLQERTENSVRDEIAKFRAEYQNQSREQREERLAGSALKVLVIPLNRKWRMCAWWWMASSNRFRKTTPFSWKKCARQLMINFMLR